MTNLTPSDFEQKPTHFLELDPVPSEDFEQYVERHLIMLRHAYTLSEGEALNSTALTDGQIERVFVPSETENNEEYFERIHQQAQTFKSTRTFSHVVTPAIVTVDGETEMGTSLLWYAEDNQLGESTLGVLKAEEVEGLHKAVTDIQRGDPKEFRGWVADAFRTILH